MPSDPLGLKLLRLTDDPAEWQTCFGLEDNPFNPALPRGGLPLGDMKLGSAPLRPHVPGWADLYPTYFALNVDHFGVAYDTFAEFLQDLGEEELYDGVIVLISGARGCGKTTLANLCRYAIAGAISGASLQCDVDLADADLFTSGGTSDHIVEIIGRGLAHTQALTSPKPTTASPSTADRHPALGLVVLRNLDLGLTFQNPSEKQAPFSYLSAVLRRIQANMPMVLFATTTKDDVSRLFKDRPPGDRTRAKNLALGELSGKDVLEHIEGRVKQFRVQALDGPAGNRYFPFHEDVVRAAFEDAQRNYAATGTLPFRTVNRLLSGALKSKKSQLLSVNPPLPAYDPTLSATELGARTVDGPCLESVLKSLYERPG